MFPRTYPLYILILVKLKLVKTKQTRSKQVKKEQNRNKKLLENMTSINSGVNMFVQAECDVTAV